jgi:GNAT superfamily N-acetyltransferase
MEISFREEPFAGPTAHALLEEFNAEIAARYPGWSPTAGPSSRAEDFAPPSGRFVVAYAEGRPVACAGLKRLDDRAAEVKRLCVARRMRGAGIGRMILTELERTAARIGYAAVRLDTGNRQPEALALFRSAGYRPIDDYNGNPFASHWFEKRLDAEVGDP